MGTADERLAKLVSRLEDYPGLVEQMPGEEGAIVQAALRGQNVHVIAHDHSMSEAAVWRILSNAARMAGGQAPPQAIETGGLGSDTDPGVTGGYDETNDFGAFGAPPPHAAGDVPGAALADPEQRKPV